MKQAKELAIGDEITIVCTIICRITSINESDEAGMVNVSYTEVEHEPITGVMAYVPDGYVAQP